MMAQRFAALITTLIAVAGCLASPDGGGAGRDPDVLFESDWSADTGASRRAVTDDGRWGNYWEFNNGAPVQLLSVVPGGPGGRNALRVVQRGSKPGYAAFVEQDNVVPPSTGYYVRFYMRNDDTSAAGDHIVTVDPYQYANLTYMRRLSGSNGWQFAISVYGCGTVYPLAHWTSERALTLGAWYRFEYHVDFVDQTHVQVHVRVYDASGSQILDDSGLRQQGWGQSVWRGRNDWTLKSYYAAGLSFCVDPKALRKFGMGNNGQLDAVDTKLDWYFARVQIRRDWWPGP
jgi:hypothetical protein